MIENGKKMYILDTKTCLAAMKNESPELTGRILSVHPDEIVVSAITLGLMEWELAGKKTNRQTELSVHLFLSSFLVILTINDISMPQR